MLNSAYHQPEAKRRAQRVNLLLDELAVLPCVTFCCAVVRRDILGELGTLTAGRKGFWPTGPKTREAGTTGLTSVIPALSIATSVPAPIAIPTWAAAPFPGAIAPVSDRDQP